ncbi:hypothetical protein [Campylobacter anatolicus]|uniref:hypothetical protein n=1 Tax=Campylobacter anatolicus TaxID=2829105 RepID=UPI001BAB6E21|nr:hypothetical protein [Campylobacter anatolicus]
MKILNQNDKYKALIKAKQSKLDNLNIKLLCEILPDLKDFIYSVNKLGSAWQGHRY